MDDIIRTPLAVSILSILRERPMHPYEIKQMMHERGHDRVTKLRGGSLYSTIGRLERDGMIAVVGTERQGRRPERTTYSLTPAGEAEFMTWLRETIATPVREYPELGSISAFLAHLMPWEAARLLRKRLALLESDVGLVEAETIERYGSDLPRLFRIHDEYASRMHQAEIDWVRDLIADIETGRLVWPDVIVAWHRRRGTWVEEPENETAASTTP
jgi:DNA-binding PadR family transcriptional regulator